MPLNTTKNRRTLAPDSTTGFLETLGVDTDDFWSRRVNSLLQAHWDPIPAYLYEMIVESQSRDSAHRITRDRFRTWGGKIDFFPGVTDILRIWFDNYAGESISYLGLGPRASAQRLIEITSGE